ncbi:MAG TPA: prephenate dehydrogenase/arogenate dehydrogenase family protein [Acidimicrobiales bacterium]|nr:prephenate dehydrogenase/arogenate dehydrogenase family protein [Acidimicrobiales bacterium]
MTFPDSRRAHVVGLGLIGASVALALQECDWSVTGVDSNAATVAAAIERGVVTNRELKPDVDLVVIATPAGVVSDVANDVLSQLTNPEVIVTDVAGVKGSIVAQVPDPRFLGGHPMAGSELRGLSGARSDLFQGSTWVLTPTDHTSPTTYSRLHGILREIGANVVAVSAPDHDRLVAIASHVPHLLAGSLMNEASQVAEQDAVLLQLAAGGFRDMTRIAAGDPAIWPDILFENRDAVAQSLQALEDRLKTLREALLDDGRDVILENLLSAASARRQLPGRALSTDDLAYLRVKVSDEPGVLARVTRSASDLGVNIYDIEIAHGIEGTGGTLLLAVDAQQSEMFGHALSALGFQVAHEL